MLGTRGTVQEGHERRAGSEAGVIILRAVGGTERFREVSHTDWDWSGTSSWCMTEGRQPGAERPVRGREQQPRPPLHRGEANVAKKEKYMWCGRLRQMWTSALPLPLPTPSPPFISSVTLISVQFSRSVVSNSLRPHGLQGGHGPHGPQHARPPCPSPTPGVHSNSRPFSR